MSKKLGVIFAAVAILWVSQAAATTPVLSGSYILTSRHRCQEVLVADVTGGDVIDALDLAQGSNGDTTLLLTAAFNAKKGTVTFAGFVDAGSTFLLQITGSNPGIQGEALGEQPNNGSGTYSNTATTLTIGSSAYNAIFGQVDKKNVAHVFSFMRLYTDMGSTCSEQGEATLQ